MENRSAEQDSLLRVRLFEAYYRARRGKRNTRNQLKFEIDFEHNLLQLAGEIEQRRYIPKPCIAFIVNKPVKREIFAADFRDRVVHHLFGQEERYETPKGGACLLLQDRCFDYDWF